MRFLALVLLLSSGAAAAQPNVLFEVEFVEVPRQVDLRHINVTFYVRKPDPEVVDRIVRQSLESAALLAPQVDIMGFAFDSRENALEDDEWGGALIWDAKSQSVMLLEDRIKNRKKAGSK